MDTLLMISVCTLQDLRGASSFLEEFLQDNVPTFSMLDAKEIIDDIIDGAAFDYIVSDTSNDWTIRSAAAQALDVVEQELSAKGCVPMYDSLREGNEDEAILFGDTYYYLEDSIVDIVTKILIDDSNQDVW